RRGSLMGRRAIRKNGIPFTGAERIKRYRSKKRAQLRAEKEAARQTRRIVVSGKVGIITKAIADIGEKDLASGSVDAVITDPPYAEADVPLYAQLAAFAIRVLKPSGWCLTMTGDLYVGRVLAHMTATGLRERGLITITFPGGHHSRIGTTKTF